MIENNPNNYSRLQGNLNTPFIQAYVSAWGKADKLKPATNEYETMLAECLEKVDSYYRGVSEEKVEELFDKLCKKLVPSSGPANTVLGEFCRIIQKLQYRYYNDGDLPDTGPYAEMCHYIKDYMPEIESDIMYGLGFIVTSGPEDLANMLSLVSDLPMKLEHHTPTNEYPYAFIYSKLLALGLDYMNAYPEKNTKDSLDYLSP